MPKAVSAGAFLSGAFRISAAAAAHSRPHARARFPHSGQNFEPCSVVSGLPPHRMRTAHSARQQAGPCWSAIMSASFDDARDRVGQEVHFIPA